MTSTHDTDCMIRALARQAGARQAAPSEGAALAVGVVLSLASAVALALLLFGVREAGLNATLASGAFHFKLAAMLTLAASGVLLARAAGRPAARARLFLYGLPAAAILLLGAATDASGLSVFGASSVSVPSCIAGIVVLSLPGLGVILAAMRQGVPTRPVFAGVVAGMLAGATGGAAYAIVCKNDAALFVAVWYVLAISLVAGLGAMIGRKALAW